MRFVLIAVLALSVVGCTRWSMNHHLNLAYSAYDRGNCEQVTLELSKVERASRARPYVWPEVSMLRKPTSSSSRHTRKANTPTAPRRAWKPCRRWVTIRCAVRRRCVLPASDYVTHSALAQRRR